MAQFSILLIISHYLFVQWAMLPFTIYWIMLMVHLFTMWSFFVIGNLSETNQFIKWPLAVVTLISLIVSYPLNIGNCIWIWFGWQNNCNVTTYDNWSNYLGSIMQTQVLTFVSTSIFLFSHNNYNFFSF